MKISILSTILTLFVMAAFSQGGPPPPGPPVTLNPGPHKICFDYDIAGNRIAQKPAFIDPNTYQTMPPTYSPDCNCNVPENTKSNFGTNIISIKNWRDLEWISEVVIDRGADISWVLRKVDLPSSVWTDVPVIGPTLLGSELSILPGITYGVVVLEDEQFSSGDNPQDVFDASIVPNPNEGQFKVIQVGFDKERSKIVITDCEGVVLFNRDYVEGDVSIGEYASGTYILILSDGNHSKVLRFIKK